MHIHEVYPRKDHQVIDLISDALPFGRLWPHRIALELLHIRTGLARVPVLGVRCLEAVTRF
jgi:hypothetical protein